MFDHQSSATVMNVFMNSTIAILVHCREHIFTIFISKRWKTETESATIGFIVDVILPLFCWLWLWRCLTKLYMAATIDDVSWTETEIKYLTF